MKTVTTTQLLAHIFFWYAIGIWSGKHLPLPIWTGAMLLIAYASLVHIRPLHCPSRRLMVSVYFSIFLLCFGNGYIQSTLHNPIPEPMYGKAVRFQGQVAYQPDRGESWYSTHAVGRAITTDGLVVTPKTRVILYMACKDGTPMTARYGDTIVVTGTFRKPAGQRNPGGFSFRDYLATQAIHGTIHKIEHIEVKRTAPGYLPLRWAESARYWIQDRLDTAYPNHNEVVRAMFLGERRSLDPGVVQQFQKSGTAHILAVSGLHVGILAGSIILIPWGKFRRVGYATTILVVICYAVIIGFQPSIIRASTKCVILIGSRFFKRKPDPMDLLLFAGIGLLLWNPSQLWDVGFQLSFASVGSILWLMPVWENNSDRWLERVPEKIKRPVKWFIAGLGIALVAQLGTLIVTAYHFNRIPVLGIPIGPFAVGLTGLAMPCILATLVDPIGIVAVVNTQLLKIFLTLIELCGDKIELVWKVKTPSLFFILVYLTFLIYLKNWVWYWVQHGKRMFYPVAAVLVLWFASIAHGHLAGRGILEVTWLDVGQGDAIFVKFPDGKTMLIDAGKCSSYPSSTIHCKSRTWDNGEKTVDPYLSYRGTFKLDVVALTHPDNDHHGGLAHIVRNFNVKHVLGVKRGYSDSFTYRNLEKAVVEANIPYTLNKARLDRLSKAVDIDLLHPRELSKKKNDNSLVIKLTYGKVRILLTGDIEGKTERYLINTGIDIDADILHVPHHGSKTSSSVQFLNAVSPKIAVVSCGLNNSYGHPHKSVLSRYESRDVQVFRTDKQGAITMRTDGKQVWAQTMEDEL